MLFSEGSVSETITRTWTCPEWSTTRWHRNPVVQMRHYSDAVFGQQGCPVSDRATDQSCGSLTSTSTPSSLPNLVLNKHWHGSFFSRMKLVGWTLFFLLKSVKSLSFKIRPLFSKEQTSLVRATSDRAWAFVYRENTVSHWHNRPTGLLYFQLLSVLSAALVLQGYIIGKVVGCCLGPMLYHQWESFRHWFGFWKHDTELCKAFWAFLYVETYKCHLVPWFWILCPSVQFLILLLSFGSMLI